MAGRGDDRALREVRWLLGIGLTALIVSGIDPYDRATWVLEVAPILVVVPALVATARRFPLTPLLYRLVFLHALVLMLGGHYTYARVPLGEWAKAWLDLGRNHYDRLGHLMQGFVPAIAARELLLRTSPLRSGRWLFVLVSAVALAGSACYEFVEWWTALALGSDASEFLATQGDVWDTQWDMFLALVGSLLAQLLLSRRHDRELAAVLATARPRPGLPLG